MPEQVGLGEIALGAIRCSLQPKANGFLVAAFFRSLFAGVGLVATGIVGATFFPQIREQLSNNNLLANATSAFDEPAPFDSDAVQEFAASDSAWGSSSDDMKEFGAAASTSDDFASGSPFGDLDAAFATATPGKSQQSGPSSTTPTGWSTVIEQLRAVGVTDYLLRPASDGRVRCECWLQDNGVRRQLSGSGVTPTEAVQQAIAAVREFESQASWFAGGVGR